MSQKNINALMRAVRKIAKEKGKPIWEVLVEMAYGDYDASPTNMLTAIKMVGDFTITKSSEQTVRHTDERKAPMVGLPPEKKDPARVIELVSSEEKKVANGE